MIAERIQLIHNQMSEAASKVGRNVQDITLIGVTKTVDATIINQAIDAGITCIGENRVQELLSKVEQLKPVEKHLIGPLQRNKAKMILDHVSLIQSMDRITLAQTLQGLAEERAEPVDVLIQINIGKELSKSGVPPDQFFDFLHELEQYPLVKVKGVMCIPPYCEGSKVIDYFAQTYDLAQEASLRNYNQMQFGIISMGMSHDFQQAIQSGATHIRVGQAIFGKRN